MSVYKRKGSPYYHVEFQLNGERIRRSTHVVSRREAQAIERQIRAEVAKQQSKPHRQSLTLDEAAGRWWAEHGHTLRSKSVETYTRQILESFGRHIELGDIRTSDVDDAVRRWRANGSGPANIGRRLSVIRSILRRADRIWGLPVHQIAWPDVTPAEPPGRVRWLTPEEAKRLIQAAENNGHKSTAQIIRFLFETGCRKGEAISLTWTDVHQARGYCDVRGKTGTRRVWLSTAAHQVLSDCPSDRVRVFDATGIEKRFRKAVRDAGLTDFRMHDCRHTFATWLRQAGAPLEVVQRSLGHRAITTTTRYAHVEDREVVRALDGLPSLSEAAENIIRLRERK